MLLKFEDLVHKMSKNIAFICLILILIIFIIGCITKDNTITKTKPNKNWETYRNEIQKIQFQFPAGFKMELDIKTQSTSRAFFTDYKSKKPFGYFDLPPSGGAHIGYYIAPYDTADFNRRIEARTTPYSKTETTIIGLPAIRTEIEAPTNTGDPNLIEKEITYFMHDENRMYNFFIEYYKGDPNDIKWEEEFELMMKTVKKLS